VGTRDHGARAPAEVCARTLDARAPARELRLGDGRTLALELRALAGEEQVRPRQAP